MYPVIGLIARAVPALLVLASRVAAQTGIVHGRIADSAGTALARARISLEATGARATSNDQGDYEIRGVPAGRHTVRVRLLGYAPQTVRVTVGEGETVQQDFTLREQHLGLAPADVIVGSRARHTMAEDLAVPVDVYPAEALA